MYMTAKTLEILPVVPLAKVIRLRLPVRYRIGVSKQHL